MRKRRNISNIIATILMLFISINSIPVSAVEELATNIGVPTLAATANNEKNFVHLDWTAPNKDKQYSYMLYSKESNEAKFQSIPTKGNENDPIRVLNVYPVAVDPTNKGWAIESETFTTYKNETYTLPKSARLKRWMEEPHDGLEKGYGQGIIDVDTIGIDEFNKNADKNYATQKSKLLKNSDGSWKYDVIMFGSWDCNNYFDLTEKSRDLTKDFIEAGRGVLFGHDTLTSGLNLRTNFESLDPYVNVCGRDIRYSGSNDGSVVSNIAVAKTGLLNNYPWQVGDIGTKLEVPLTHSSQGAKGDIWMRFSHSSYNADDMKSKDNFYLTTWNNTALIQTGHSNGVATKDEQKLLANTLFYLAQVTENTSWDDHKGQDVAAPSKPNINSVKYTDKNIEVDFNNSTDIGSEYEYYVEATEKTTGNKSESTHVTQKVTTGLKGYSIVVDKNENTIPDNEIETTDVNYTIDGTYDGDFYVHVAAVDNAGNVSEVSTYKYTFPTLKLTAGEVENNTVKITAEGNDKVTKIVLPNNEEVTSNKAEYTVSANGTYNFSAFDKDGNKVTESIKVNNLATDVTLDVTDNENSASLNWSVSDKSQDYSYTVNSTREDGSKNSVSSLTETSFEDTNAKDVAAPSKPDITKVNTNRKDNTTTIKFNESTDKGTKYDFNVEAKAKETELVSTSETKSATIMSGIKGYSVVVDNNENTIPDGTITTTSNELALNKAYEGKFYVHVAAVDRAGNMSEVSTYKYSYPTLILTANTTEIVKDNVKITADATKSANKVVKIITPDGKEVAKDKTEYTVDENGEYTFIAIDEDGNKTEETITITNIVPDIILNVEPNMNKSHLKEKVAVDLTINNIKDIYGTIVKVKYDSSKLEFLGFDQVEGVELTYDDREDGELMFLLSSLDINYPMVGKSTLIKMNFRGIDAGDASIDIVEGIVADGEFLEKNLRNAECGSTTINICERQLKDKYTLLDLTRIVKHYGDKPEELLKQGLDLDLNLDGKIDKDDYKKCQELMIGNYK